MPETLVVTGAAGFIGSHLSAALLMRGCRVIGVDNFDSFYDRRAKLSNMARIMSAKSRGRPTSDFELIEADIRDSEAMRNLFARGKPHGVFHIAALAGVRPSIADPARYVSVNLDGLVSVLDAARAARCNNIVFASSSSVYGNNKKVPFAETDPVDEPISPYAASKRAGELICHTYSRLFAMRIAALRFFTVFGPAQRPDLAISTFMKLIARGDEVPMFGDGTTSRDYTYIDDIVAGVLAAHEILQNRQTTTASPADSGDSSFRIYNLGNSHPISLGDMINGIAKVVGKPARVKRLPMQPGDVERTWADLTRSARELGYQPSTSFHDGLERQWAWLREQQATATLAGLHT